MTKERNGFWCWLSKVKTLLVVTGVVGGSTIGIVLTFANFCNKVEGNCVQIKKNTETLKTTRLQIDSNSLAVRLLQEKVDNILVNQEKFYQESRETWKVILTQITRERKNEND